MSEDNPVVAQWARLEGHEFDLQSAASAFKQHETCRIDLDDDGHYYLKAPELFEVRDGWEFKRAAEEFLDRVNGAMKADPGPLYEPILFKAVVPIRENGTMVARSREYCTKAAQSPAGDRMADATIPADERDATGGAR